MYMPELEGLHPVILQCTIGLLMQNLDIGFFKSKSRVEYGKMFLLERSDVSFVVT